MRSGGRSAAAISWGSSLAETAARRARGRPTSGAVASNGSASLVVLHRQLHHEAGPLLAVGPVLDPHLAAVQVHVLGDQRQAEAHALGGARGARPTSRGRSGRTRAGGPPRARPAPRSSTAIWMPSSTRRSATRGGAVAVLVARCRGGWRSPARCGACRRGRRRRPARRRARWARRRRWRSSRPASRARPGAPPPARAGPRPRRTGRSRAGPPRAAGSASTSATMRSRAAWARSGSSSRWLPSTSIEAARVISGERSSWLTSEANRASCSMRSWRAWAMSLNDAAIGRRSGSTLGSRRVSSWPVASAERRARHAREGAERAAGGPGRRGRRRPAW